MTGGVHVRVTEVAGSSPREAGATMFVTDAATKGSIGGGRLEWEAIDTARNIIAGHEPPGRKTIALGPEIGQCCGGKVTLEFSPGPEPQSHIPDVLIFGGGHVGAALGKMLDAMPLSVRIIDSRPGYGEPAPIPEATVRAAPPGAAYIIVTHDHALDFLIVEEVLRRGDASYVGMIGSQTKRSILEKRLRAEGLDPDPLICPIGAQGKGDKRPHVIALHTAAEILNVLDP